MCDCDSWISSSLLSSTLPPPPLASGDVFYLGSGGGFPVADWSLLSTLQICLIDGWSGLWREIVFLNSLSDRPRPSPGLPVDPGRVLRKRGKEVVFCTQGFRENLKVVMKIIATTLALRVFSVALWSAVEIKNQTLEAAMADCFEDSNPYSSTFSASVPSHLLSFLAWCVI